MNRYAKEIDYFVDGVNDALAEKWSEKIIPHGQMKNAIKAL